jgi:hypothetical protein
MMNEDDAQALRDIKYFTSRLLEYAGVHPPDLAVMLKEYELELGNASLERWASAGNPSRYDDLAARIGRSITDGEWPPGTCLDWSRDKEYCWVQTRENVMSALQLLAVRGELTLKCGNYYVRSGDENS